jgi:hypothetical protein
LGELKRTQRKKEWTQPQALPSENPIQSIWGNKRGGVDVAHTVNIELTGAGGFAHGVDGQHGVVASVLRQGQADTQRAVAVLCVLDLIAARPLDALAVLVPGNLLKKKKREKIKNIEITSLTHAI